MGWRKMAQIHYWTPNVNDGHQLFLVQAESIEAFWEWRWADFSLCLKTQQLEDIPQPLWQIILTILLSYEICPRSIGPVSCSWMCLLSYLNIL